jgi:hypothetical protein
MEQILFVGDLYLPIFLEELNVTLQGLLGFFDAIAYGYTAIVPRINLNSCSFEED